MATAALRLALEKLAALGVEPALITYRETNSASARVIEKCGGRRIEDSFVDQHVERRYWVPTLAQSASPPIGLRQHPD